MQEPIKSWQRNSAPRKCHHLPGPQSARPRDTRLVQRSSTHQQHMLIPTTEAEKALDKIQHMFKTKTCENEDRGEFPQLDAKHLLSVDDSRGERDPQV